MPDTAMCTAADCGTTSHSPRPAAPGLTLCPWHHDRLRRDLDVTPSLARWLSHHTAAGGSTREPVSGSREPGTPLRLDVMSMLLPGAVHPVDGDDQTGPPSIPSTLAAWLWQVCSERGLTEPERWDDIDELARRLRPHLDWCAARPWAGEMAADLAALRRAAHALAPWLVQRSEKNGVPCPRCDAMALVQTAGERYIECEEEIGGCGRLLYLDDYDTYTTALAAAEAA